MGGSDGRPGTACSRNEDYGEPLRNTQAGDKMPQMPCRIGKSDDLPELHSVTDLLARESPTVILLISGFKGSKRL